MELLSKHSLMKTRNIILLFTAFAFAQCAQESSEPSVNIPDEDTAVRWKTQIPALASGAQEIHFTGTYEVREDGQAVVAFPTAVKVESYKIKPGEQVRKGSLLATVSHPDVAQLKKAYIDAKQRYEWAEASYVKWEKLHASGNASEMEWQDAKHAMVVAKSELSAAESSLSDYGIMPEQATSATSKIQVLSPIDGQILSLGVAKGGFLPAESSLVEVIGINSGRVSALVSPQIAKEITVGSTVHFSSGVHSAEGRVTAIAQRANAAGLVQIWMDVTAPNNFVYGESLKAAVKSYSEGIWSLPSTALQYEGAQTYVVVKTDAGFEKQYISVRHETDELVFFEEDLGAVNVVVEHPNRAAATLVD